MRVHILSDLPRSLAEHYLEEFQEQLPGVRDGDTESIHRARVATRRLREVLPLLVDETDPMLATIRTAGRALGRARDVDVVAAMLVRAEARMPSAALAVALARQRIGSAQQRSRRRLIKRLESLAIDELQLANASTAALGRLRDRWLSRWKEPLRSRRQRRRFDGGRSRRRCVLSESRASCPNRDEKAALRCRGCRRHADVACRRDAARSQAHPIVIR